MLTTSCENKIKKGYQMFIQSKAATDNKHKNGLCIAQRRGGRETLVQWSNGDQQWCITEDLVGKVVLVGEANHG